MHNGGHRRIHQDADNAAVNLAINLEYFWLDEQKDHHAVVTDVSSVILNHVYTGLRINRSAASCPM